MKSVLCVYFPVVSDQHMATDHSTHSSRSAVVYSYWPQTVVLGGIIGVIRPLLSILGGIGPTAGVLTTLPGFELWWAIHIGYSAVFGAGYGIAVYNPRLRPHSESIPTGAVLGLGYGIALWIGNIVIGWNLVITNSLLPMTDAIDPLATGPIVDHLLYGVALGVVYAIVVPRFLTDRT